MDKYYRLREKRTSALKPHRKSSHVGSFENNDSGKKELEKNLLQCYHNFLTNDRCRSIALKIIKIDEYGNKIIFTE